MIELAARRGRGVQIRRKKPERPMEDKPRGVPRPSPYSWGAHGTHVLQRPPVAAPQSPPLPARPQTALAAARETRHAQSFRARRLEKGRGQAPEPRSAGVAGAAPRLAAMARGLGPNGLPPPQGFRGAPKRDPGPPNPEGEELLPYPNLLAVGGRGTRVHDGNGMPTSQGCATRVCLELLGMLFSFS